MFNKIKEYFLSLLSSRVLYLLIVFAALFGILIGRIFDLQIVHGAEYQQSFQLKSKKERSIDAVRGNIYDCNGVLIAYNELAYSVTIEDVYESGKTKNQKLNNTIYKAINLIEQNGDEIITDFNIKLDENYNYKFTLSGTRLNRFKADIYGRKYIDEMTYAESSATADEMMAYLVGEDRFNIQIENISKEKALQIVAIRYAMSLNAYQKYISTTIASNVSDKTVAVIYENEDILKGVKVSEDTKRVYPDGLYMSQVVGYTGKISADELAEYADDDSYSLNDIIGKTGIEKSMDSVLRGQKGYEEMYVNTTGKVLSVENHVEPVAGNDIYLSIDSKWQKEIYKIMEQALAGVLLQKIDNAKEYKPKENATANDIRIPIYDVYYALIDNSVININHFSDEDATDNEKAIYEVFLKKKESVFEKLEDELMNKHTIYKKLTTEMKVYENAVEDTLKSKEILVSSLIDKSDPAYIAWYTDETISLYEYLNYAISKSWIDSDKLDLSSAYSESSEIYEQIVKIALKSLSEDLNFEKKIYKYIVKGDLVNPKAICQCLIDQNLVKLSDSDLTAWESGKVSAYSFMIDRITNLDITPAQLALEPYVGSMVVTDVKTGKVKALVSYPSYDNNYLANGADSKYLAKIKLDKSMPLFNYATQQRTAPGSTYKMITSTAGLMEGLINLRSLITCSGTFTVTTDTHKCWAYPSSHGAINVTSAIEKSCNCFYYTLGYKMSLDEKGNYVSQLGVDKLNEYASLYGFNEKSGVEIEEYPSILTSAYSVPSAIGQGTNSFTTTSLARYVNTIANRGVNYRLTLLDKICDNEGNLIKECKAEVSNIIEMPEENWDAIFEGMRRVIVGKRYYKELPFELAGKTGTAQQSKTSPDHGLFVSFAPLDNPQYSIACRIANGYVADFASQPTKNAYKYIFNVDQDKKDNQATDIDTSYNTRE